MRRLEHRYRVFAVCAAGIFTTVFDTSASIVALPTIALEFGTDLPTAQWVLIGNTLTIAALLVPMGRLSDLIGRKRIYVVGCCLFALGSILAVLAPTIYALIGARVFVGIGSAMTQGTAMAILVGNFEIHERARMLGLQMAGVGLGAMAGPALGGFVVGAAGWRLLFVLTAIAMIVTATAAQRVLRRRVRRPDSGAPPFDIAGAVLFSSLLVAGLLTLTLGPGAGWLAPATLGGIALFILLLGGFVLVERRHSAPMLDFALFRNGAFAFGALGAVVVFMGISATRFLAPFFLQAVRGLNPSQVGMLLLPAAVVTAVTAPFVGRFADRFGVRALREHRLRRGRARPRRLHTARQRYADLGHRRRARDPRARDVEFQRAELRVDPELRRLGRAWGRRGLREPVPQHRQRARHRVRHGDRDADDGQGRIPAVPGRRRSGSRRRRLRGVYARRADHLAHADRPGAAGARGPDRRNAQAQTSHPTCEPVICRRAALRLVLSRS
jgi:MFS family permease